VVGLDAALDACRHAGQWTQQRAARWWTEVGHAQVPAATRAYWDQAVTEV